MCWEAGPSTYPAGILLLVSVILLASRLLMKFMARNHYPWE